MTIAIGVLCQDGVVVGTDSSATFGVSRVRTIEQPCKKIEIIDNHIIITGTGQIGLGQRFTEIVDTYWKEKRFRGKTAVHACRELCALGVKDFISTNVPPGAYGSLVAFAANGKFNLCEFALENFQPELKTNNIWYVAMGSGQNIGDPFLGLIRRVFWKDIPPKISGGIFAVVWALEHVIDLNPGGIKGPPQMAILEHSNGDFRARMLEDSELAEHRDSVRDAEKHLEKYKEILEGKSDKKIPEPPDSSKNTDG